MGGVELFLLNIPYFVYLENILKTMIILYVVGAQQLLSNHCISDILWSLCDMAVEAEQQLRKDTSSIDLQRDTQQLKCVFVVCIFPAIFYVCVSVHVSLCCRCVCVW